MARVRPFRAWRYARTERDITPLVAPPYDVITEEQREMLLARDSHNAVALELPEGPLDVHAAGNRYETGARRWEEWRRTGVVTQDLEPSLYVLRQEFTQGSRKYVRQALLAEVGLEPFDAGVILPHERTLPRALGDRFELIRATAANFSPIFALYDDPACDVDRMLNAQLDDSDPLVQGVGDDGVHSSLWAITDADLIARVTAAFAAKQLFIADGHHRYTTALSYRDLRRSNAEAQPGPDPAYDFVLVALVNMDDPDLLVLPTHRVADAEDGFDADAFWSALAETFEISEVGPGHPAQALEQLSRPGFLVLARGDERPKLVTVRADVDLDEAIPLERSAHWKQLDVAVLQELILLPLLGIHPDRPESLDRLSFVKDAHDAMKQVSSGAHDVSFVLRSTRMDELRAVALSGETMPQKSTYFHPKLLSGMLYRSAE